MRATIPMFAGAIINRLVARWGGRASDAGLSEKWSEIVGDDCVLIKISKSADGRGRIATIRAKNPAGRLALTYRKAEIQSKINDFFGFDAVAKIVVK